MAKFSQLTEITDITDSDLMMITDAETSASRRITWGNVKASINSLSGGVSSTPYKFSTTTTAEPATKTLRFNNSTPSSVTQIFIHKTNNVSNDLSNVIPVLLTAGTRIYVQTEGTAAQYLAATIDSITEVNSTYTLNVSSVTAGTLPSNNAKVVLAVIGNNAEDTKADLSGDTFTGAITVQSNDNNGGRLNIQQSNDGTGGPNLLLKKSRGTVSSLSLVNNNDTIGKVSAYAYANDGGFDAFLLSGNFGWVADGTDGDSTFELKQRISGNMFTALSTEADGTVVAGGDFIHSPASSNTPTTNGQMTFEATNDTTITVKYKGSDGVVRSGTISLS